MAVFLLQIISVAITTRRLSTSSAFTCYARRLYLATTLQFAQTPYTISCPPTESQTLISAVTKHVLNLDRYLEKKPIAPHTATAFQLAQQKILLGSQAPLILDSGCGTGRSSLLLGSLYPDACVIGVDRSIARLEKNNNYIKADTDVYDPEELVENIAENVWLIRAELVDFWRCARQANLVFDRHFLLYPNPYPKKSRLQSRWYAHPSFPLLLQSSPCITVRSNWKQFLVEMAQSVQIADTVLQQYANQRNYARPFVSSTLVEPRLRAQDEEPWTNFEEKYQRANEATYELLLMNDSDSKE